MTFIPRRRAALLAPILQLLSATLPHLAAAVPVLQRATSISEDDTIPSVPIFNIAVRQESSSSSSSGTPILERIGLAVLLLFIFILAIFIIGYVEWRRGCTSCFKNRRQNYSPTDGDLRECWAAHGRGQLLEWDWTGGVKKVPHDGSRGCGGLWREIGGETPNKRKLMALWYAYGVAPYFHSTWAGESGGGT